MVTRAVIISLTFFLIHALREPSLAVALRARCSRNILNLTGFWRKSYRTPKLFLDFMHFVITCVAKFCIDFDGGQECIQSSSEANNDASLPQTTMAWVVGNMGLFDRGSAALSVCDWVINSSYTAQRLAVALFVLANCCFALANCCSTRRSFCLATIALPWTLCVKLFVRTIFA